MRRPDHLERHVLSRLLQGPEADRAASLSPCRARAPNPIRSRHLTFSSAFTTQIHAENCLCWKPIATTLPSAPRWAFRRCP
ncbi:hypothetical protein [Lysobacter gummosus]|uniref:hypothetical protein n=1 Tax=Lysobacter gummosus TaxID=262324 RepID=UPI00362BDC25